MVLIVPTSILALTLLIMAGYRKQSHLSPK
jgi:hypothetical protein